VELGRACSHDDLDYSFQAYWSRWNLEAQSEPLLYESTAPQIQLMFFVLHSSVFFFFPFVLEFLVT
jgi:hypothetical protein